MSVIIHKLGGQKSLRSYWRNYFEVTDALIFVVDSIDVDRMQMCQKELSILLQEERLLGIPVLILANKQDLEGALSMEEIRQILLLDKIYSHWNIVPSSAVTGQGLMDGLGWLVKNVSGRLFALEA